MTPGIPKSSALLIACKDNTEYGVKPKIKTHSIRKQRGDLPHHRPTSYVLAHQDQRTFHHEPSGRIDYIIKSLFQRDLHKECSHIPHAT